jgi:hypothetical protein
MAKGGARPGAGNPGYGKMEFIRQKVTEFSPLWWEQWSKMMKSKAKGDVKFAMDQFNRLQTKMIPQEVGGVGGEAIKIEWSLPCPTVPASGQTTSIIQLNDG